MSIRIRNVDGVTIAICAARSVAKEGDIYLDDAAHHALTIKFGLDFDSMFHIEGTPPLIGPKSYVTEQRLMEQEESNNPNRYWWDQIYGGNL
jgi:hypothetical protein